MAFAFSDLFGLVWVFIFPAFLHILNAYNGRNSGITAPRLESRTYQPIKTQRKRAISHPEKYRTSKIIIKPEIKAKPEIKIKPVTQINRTPVSYTPETKKPSVTLARPWIPVCCILPMKVKPAKFKKARKPRAPSFEKLTKEDISNMKAHLSTDIFKRLNYFELAHLKTAATKRGIDDWISLIDSRLSYEENRANLTAQYGAQDSDSELMQKYRDYTDMARDEYT